MTHTQYTLLEFLQQAHSHAPCLALHLHYLRTKYSRILGSIGLPRFQHFFRLPASQSSSFSIYWREDPQASPVCNRSREIHADTENQTYAGDSRQTTRTGKAIGGMSTINGQLVPGHIYPCGFCTNFRPVGITYTQAQNVQMDAWGSAGNEVGTGKTFCPTMRNLKALRFILPIRLHMALETRVPWRSVCLP